ncbi:MAG: thiamine pyrophosphate-binding protein [Pseudomonadota bacterium]|nr:thiamine pyrophosphate-binding protein [Pseudomonadota bacterium]
MRKYRGADALAASLAAEGVKRIFTLSGNHVMPVFDAALDAGIELIHVRHEGAAVHMADAWARLTGEVGVALVTGGPGHANAVGALYTAAMAESPMVLLSGHAPLNQLGMAAFQELRQVEMVAPVTKAAGGCANAEDIGRDFSHAVRVALSGRPGPVHLSLPTDVLEATVAPGAAPAANATVVPGAAVAAMDWGPIAAALTKSARPLILCGPSCMRRAGRELMADLEAASGIPVIGMESPRGVGDPSLGAFAQMLAQADCVLLVGKRIDFTLKFGRAFADGCEFLQIDPERSEHERTRRAVAERLTVTAQAEAMTALETLARAFTKSSTSGWRNEVRAAIAFRPAEWDDAIARAPGLLHPVQALRPLQALLDEHPDSVLVSDGGEFGQWAQACLHAPHRVINGVAGSIGAALPFALAARLAQPRAPVIAVLGDGTFGFHPAEIDTGVRYRLPFVAVVGNDARWNAEYQIQLRDYGRERLVGCELLPTRYDQVAAGFGGHGELVTTAEQLLPAARRAMGLNLPAVLNVMIEAIAAPNVRR